MSAWEVIPIIYNLPLGNLISNQFNTQGGIAAVYQWDNTIFENFHPPKPIDKISCIDAILFLYGDAPLYRPEPTYLKHFIGGWSAKNQTVWEKLYATTQFEYNPIYNYDRTEEHTERRSGTKKDVRNYDESINRNGDSAGTRNQTTENENHGESTDTGNVNVTGNDTTTGEQIDQVSAENADTFQNDTKRNTSGETTNKNITDTTNDTVTNATANTRVDDTTADQWKDASIRGGKDTLDNTYGEDVTTTIQAQGNIGVTSTQSMIRQEREIVQFRIEDFIARSFYEEFCILVW